jgi:hypothetical protein
MRRVSLCRIVSLMNTQRDTKILVHVAAPLKAKVDAAAAAEGRSTSDFVRRLLIQHFVDNPSVSEQLAA